MPVAQVVTLLNNSAVSADTIDVDALNAQVRAFIVTTAGFSGVLTPKGAGPFSGYVNARYRQRVVGTAATYAASTSGDITLTTDTNVRVILITEPWPILKMGLTRSAGTISITFINDPFYSADLGIEALIASEAHIGSVGGQVALIEPAEFIRPNDSSAYAALDGVSDSTSAPTIITLTNAARVAGGNGYITGVTLWTSQAANVARFKLHIYHTAPTAVNDNAAFPLLYANKAKKLVAPVIFPAMASEGTGSTAARMFDISNRLPFICDVADRNLYALLETLDAFTPDALQKFFLSFNIDQN